MPEASQADPDFAALVAALVGRHGVTLGSGKRGFGSDSLQVGGRIFAMHRRGRLILKLPRERVATLVASGDGEPFDAGKGKPMKEWIVVLPGTRKRQLSLAKEALTFVAGTPTSASVFTPESRRRRPVRP